MSTCVYVHALRLVIGSVGAGVTNNWKLSNMGVGKCTQVL